MKKLLDEILSFKGQKVFWPIKGLFDEVRKQRDEIDELKERLSKLEAKKKPGRKPNAEKKAS